MKKHFFSFLLLAAGLMMSTSAWAEADSDAANGVASLTVGSSTTYYSTLAKAVADAPTDGTQATITMLKSTIIPQGTGYGVKFPAGTNIILELNGKVISGQDYSNGGYGMLSCNGTLTIQDNSTEKTGAINYNSVTSSIWHNTNTINVDQGKLTILSGSYGNLGTIAGASYVVNLSNNTQPVEVVIEGGTFANPYGDAVVRMHAQNNTRSLKLTINNGSFTGGMYDSNIWVDCQGSVHKNTNVVSAPQLIINGGTFEAVSGKPCIDLGHEGYPRNWDIQINGGYFKSDASIINYRDFYSQEEVKNQVVVKGGYFSNKITKFVVYTYNETTKKWDDGVGTNNELADVVVSGKSVINNDDNTTNTTYPWTIGVPSYPVTMYLGSSTGESKTFNSVSEWEGYLTDHPNAVAEIEYSVSNQAFADATKNIIVHRIVDGVNQYTCPKLVLQDTPDNKEKRDFYAEHNFTAKTGTYTRSLGSNYNTCSLPFALTSDVAKIDNDAHDVSIKYLVFYGYKIENDGSKTAVFNDYSELNTVKPCLIYCSKAATLTATFDNTAIVNEGGNDNTGNLKGTFTKNTSWASDGNKYSLVAGGAHFASSAASTVYPFRAVLDLSEATDITQSGAPARSTSISLVDNNGMVTELDEATLQTIDQPIYTIDGRMVGKSVPSTGLYIVNGKVQFIRK